MAKQVDKKAMACNKPKRTPSHPKKSHVVKACEGGKEKVIRLASKVRLLLVNPNRANLLR
jgi:hypothetical protein